MFPKRLLTIYMLLVTTLGVVNCVSRPARPYPITEAPPLLYAGEMKSALDQALKAGQCENEPGIPAIGHGGSTYGYTAAALYLPGHEASLVWMINTGESPRALADAIMGSTWSAFSNALPQTEPAETLKSPKPLLKKFVNGG
jgi:hypothetical protein